MSGNKLLVWMVCLLLGATGCTPSARWGHRAFYSPAHRGYVISAEASDDRPREWAPTIVLVNPLDGEKLACHEDVLPFLGAHTQVNADDVTRENVAIASGLGLFPFTAMGAMGLYVGMVGAAYSIGPALLAVPDAQARYHEGLDAFKEKRFGAARKKLEMALAGDSAVARGTPALFKIGRAYEELGEAELAARSYNSFLRRAWVPAEAEYMRAEAYLKEHGAEVSECQSRKDIEVIWPD